MVAALRGVGFIADVLKSQYELTELEGGAVVYAFTGFPKHYACPYCFEQGIMQVLQYRRIGSGAFECLGCKTSFLVKQEKRKVVFGDTA
jgi:hypothetical protein